MQLQLNDEQLTAAITGAILGTLTPETRAELIGQALKHLMTPDTSGVYGRDKRTPIQRAFEEAAIRVARSIADEHMAQDAGVRAQIKALVDEGWGKVMSDYRRESIAMKIGDAIAKALTGD